MLDITIIIPVYNRKKYIKKCLDNLLQQDLTNIEIILVDDGSTDGSEKICDYYSKINPIIKVVHQPNLGVAAARNTGLRKAKGKWISWIDSDDLVSQDYINTLKKIAESDFDIIVFKYQVFTNKLPEDVITKKGIRLISKPDAMQKLSDTDFGNFLWNKLFRKKLFSKISFPENMVYEDVATTYRLLDKAKKIGCIDKTIYYYRQNNKSIVHQHNSEKAIQMLEDRIKNQNKLVEFLKDRYPNTVSEQARELLEAVFEYIKEIEKGNYIKNCVYDYSKKYVHDYEPSLLKDGFKICVKVFLYNNFYHLYKFILKKNKK